MFIVKVITRRIYSQKWISPFPTSLVFLLLLFFFGFFLRPWEKCTVTVPTLFGKKGRKQKHILKCVFWLLIIVMLDCSVAKFYNYKNVDIMNFCFNTLSSNITMSKTTQHPICILSIMVVKNNWKIMTIPVDPVFIIICMYIIQPELSTWFEHSLNTILQYLASLGPKCFWI